MRSPCVCLTFLRPECKEGGEKREMKSALCISAVLHTLFFSAVIEIGTQNRIPRFHENPKVIEVELAAPPHIAGQAGTGRKAMPRAAKALPRVPPPEAVPQDTKPVIATPAAPLPIPPIPVREETAASAVAFATSAVASGGATEGNGSGGDSAGLAGGAKGSSGVGGSAAHGGTNSTSSMLPYLIASPPPAYPADARLKGWTGRVRVRVLISEQGTVRDTVIAVSSGHACLDDAALKGLRRWLFHPAYQDGRAIAAWVIVPVLFKLD